MFLWRKDCARSQDVCVKNLVIIYLFYYFYNRKLLHELVTSLSRGVLLTHEKLVQEQKSNLTQNQALQILFDLRVVMSILMGRGENERECSDFSDRLEQVTDTLESCVDPFDLDVFSPHISTNLNRQLQRCGVCVINISCALLSCTFLFKQKFQNFWKGNSSWNFCSNGKAPSDS